MKKLILASALLLTAMPLLAGGFAAPIVTQVSGLAGGGTSFQATFADAKKKDAGGCDGTSSSADCVKLVPSAAAPAADAGSKPAAE